MRISDLSSDVCSSDLAEAVGREHLARDALDGGEHLGIGDPRAAQVHDEADLARCCHYSNTFSMRFMVSRWVRSRCSGVTEMPPSAVTARSVSVSAESSTWSPPIHTKRRPEGSLPSVTEVPSSRRPRRQTKRPDTRLADTPGKVTLNT